MSKRPSLTTKQKLLILLRYTRCPGVGELGIDCGVRFDTLTNIQFDHVGQRSITDDDTISNYRPLCGSCHDIKTNGLGGTKRITTAGSDTHRRAKIRRLDERWSDFMRALSSGNKPTSDRLMKNKWPSRKIPTRIKKKG